MAGDLGTDVRIDELNPAHLLNLLNDLLQYLHIGVERSANCHVQIKRQFALVVCWNPVSTDAGIERDCRRKNCQGEDNNHEAMVERPCQKPAVLGRKAVKKSYSSGAVLFFAGF